MRTRTGYRNLTLSARRRLAMVEYIAAILATTPTATGTAWVLPDPTMTSRYYA